MNYRRSGALSALLPAAMLLASTALHAQVPVDEDGNVIGAYEASPNNTYSTEQATGNEGIPLLSTAELQELVGPIALYPDDLLAIALAASTYPLQVVQAARFLEELESDPGLEPDPDWDDSIVALINYPEVVALLNEDLDWTWRLGEAVVAQQADVVNAVEEFRNRAYAAGNLKSDRHQTVSRNEDVIEITPVNEEIIYVPYYEPARVVYYQPRPVYFYYPRPCPVYYYPYPASYAFDRGFFWGVTTAFTIGWRSDHLRVFHHSYRGHPFYGVRYWDRWWYRRPTIHVHNNVYINNSVRVTNNRYRAGDYWRPSRSTRLRASDQRITRSEHYPSRRSTSGRNQITRSIDRTATVNSREQSRQLRERPVVERNGNVDRRQTFTTEQRHSAESRGQQRTSTSRQAVDRQARERRAADRQTSLRQQLAVNSERRSEPSPPTVRQPSANSQQRSYTSERRVPTSQQRTYTTERRAQPSQRHTQTAERRAPRSQPPRQQDVPRSQPAMPQQRQSQSSDRRAQGQSNERRASSSSRNRGTQENTRRR